MLVRQPVSAQKHAFWIYNSTRLLKLVVLLEGTHASIIAVHEKGAEAAYVTITRDT